MTVKHTEPAGLAYYLEDFESFAKQVPSLLLGPSSIHDLSHLWRQTSALAPYNNLDFKCQNSVQRVGGLSTRAGVKILGLEPNSTTPQLDRFTSPLSAVSGWPRQH
jgi:hypothetical protein